MISRKKKLLNTYRKNSEYVYVNYRITIKETVYRNGTARSTFQLPKLLLLLVAVDYITNFMIVFM